MVPFWLIINQCYVCVPSFSTAYPQHHIQNGAIASIVLQPRSLIFFTGEAYSDYMHEILAVEEEIVGEVEGGASVPVLNLEVSLVVSKEKAGVDEKG